MADDDAARAVPDETRRSIERWFAARGVPQLIEGYGSEQRIDARAIPLIGGWIVLGTMVIWIQRPEIYFAGRSLSDLRVAAWTGRAIATDIGATLVALAATGLVIGIYLRIRKHPPFGSRTRLDIVDIAVWAWCRGSWPRRSPAIREPRQASLPSSSPASQ